MKSAIAIFVICASFVLSANAQSITLTRPNSASAEWYAGETGYIAWNGGASYVSIAYKYSGQTYYTTITSSTTNYGSYTWSIPTYVSGYIYVRVCNYGSTTVCDTNYYAQYVNSYNNTIYISPAAWVVPTIFAICVIIGVISCYRSRRCCFANRSGVDVYVPVTAAQPTYVQPAEGVYVQPQPVAVAYAQPAYQAAPGGAYYPSQQPQQVYYAPQ